MSPPTDVEGLRFFGPADPDHLDPTSAYHVRPGQLLRVLSRQLFSYPVSRELATMDDVFEPVPDVARELPTRENGGLSADGLVYTIRLRDGVNWDTVPPRPVTAHDFARGLKRTAVSMKAAGIVHYYTGTIRGLGELRDAFRDAPVGRSYNDFPVEGVEAIDDRTLVLRLYRPANDLLNILALGYASAAPREYDEHAPDALELGRTLISNGPYRVGRYSVERRRLMLEPNPNWDARTDPLRRQSVPTIEVRAIDPTSGDALSAIRAGEVDLAWHFGIVSWARSNPDLDRFPDRYPGYGSNPYLVFNLHSPNQAGAIQKRQVRNAVAYAVNRPNICAVLDALEGVSSRPLRSMIPPGNRGYRDYDPHPTVEDRGDRERARALLAEAGHPDGVELIAAVRDIPLHRALMEQLAVDLAPCGIRLRQRVVPASDYYGSLLTNPDQARAGAWDLAAPGWTPDWFGNNGRATLQPIFTSDFSEGTTNYGGYDNSEVAQLIADALEEMDPVRSADLWHRADEQLMRDLPIVPLAAFACRCCAPRTGAGGGTWWPPRPAASRNA